MHEQVLIEKIRKLPPDRQSEVEDFVDFLNHRDEDRVLTQAAARLSEEAFRQVWDNETDSAYDKLQVWRCGFSTLPLHRPKRKQKASRDSCQRRRLSLRSHQSNPDGDKFSGQRFTSSREVIVSDWKKAGLIGPSVVKAVMTTIERSW